MIQSDTGSNIELGTFYHAHGNSDHIFQQHIFLEIFQNCLRLCDESYLVGGAIRDALLGLERISDLDIAVEGDGYDIARKIAGSVSENATFVPLDKVRRIGRVVFCKPHSLVVDFSSFKGSSITDDLHGRDFTINSMGAHLWDVMSGRLFQAIIDPVGGRDDLRQGVIRTSSNQSFLDDPLRMLRAFRFKAQLKFRIDPGALTEIPDIAYRIRSVAGERVRDELAIILFSTNSHESVGEMSECGLLWSIFPQLIECDGFAQNDFHHLDVWKHSLLALKNLEDIVGDLPVFFEDMGEIVQNYLDEEPVPGRPRIWLLKLAVIFHDSGKPASLSVDQDGRRRFFGHEKISQNIMSDVANRIKLSSRETSEIISWVQGHMRSSILSSENISNRAMIRLCNAFERNAIGLALLHLADISASQGPSRGLGEFPRSRMGAQKLVELVSERERSPVRPFLNGNDIMSEFGLAQGPKLGSTLRWLITEQSLGNIKDKSEAIEAVRRYLSPAGTSPTSKNS